MSRVSTVNLVNFYEYKTGLIGNCSERDISIFETLSEKISPKKVKEIKKGDIIAWHGNYWYKREQ